MDSKCEDQSADNACDPGSHENCSSSQSGSITSDCEVSLDPHATESPVIGPTTPPPDKLDTSPKHQVHVDGAVVQEQPLRSYIKSEVSSPTIPTAFTGMPHSLPITEMPHGLPITGMPHGLPITGMPHGSPITEMSYGLKINTMPEGPCLLVTDIFGRHGHCCSESHKRPYASIEDRTAAGSLEDLPPQPSRPEKRARSNRDSSPETGLTDLRTLVLDISRSVVDVFHKLLVGPDPTYEELKEPFDKLQSTIRAAESGVEAEDSGFAKGREDLGGQI